MEKLKSILLLLFISNSTLFCADLIIFSYDRPLQLYALLESIEKYVSGLEKVHIIYRTSSKEFSKAYDELKNTFEWASFQKQSRYLIYQDFKPMTLEAIEDGPSNYIIFGVDDIIVKDYIDLARCEELLESTNAYGFFFRLGLNLKWSYTRNIIQEIPPHSQIEEDVFSYVFEEAQQNWRYPNNLDMTLYRKQDVVSTLTKIKFNTPNTLEATWSMYVDYKKKGLCFSTTKIVNLPLNIVQNNFKNRCMNFASPGELLEVFSEGKKIDIRLLHKIDNKSAHMEYKPQFIGR